MKKAFIRSNRELNKAILDHIADWKGTVHGSMLKTMWENGVGYEQICLTAGIEMEDYLEEEIFLTKQFEKSNKK
jgi:hypothetical protein